MCVHSNMTAYDLMVSVGWWENERAHAHRCACVYMINYPVCKKKVNNLIGMFNRSKNALIHYKCLRQLLPPYILRVKCKNRQMYVRALDRVDLPKCEYSASKNSHTTTRTLFSQIFIAFRFSSAEITRLYQCTIILFTVWVCFFFFCLSV